MRDFPKEEAEGEVKQNSPLNPKRGKKVLFKNKEKQPSGGSKKYETPSHFALAMSQQQWKCRKRKLNSRKKKGEEDQI